MIRSYILIPVLLLMLFLPGKAQQQPMISQYMMNKYLVNPAMAGVTGYTDINITARQQYTGFHNPPQTFLLSAQTRLLEDSWILRRQKVEKKAKQASRARHVGLGGYVFNDKNGIISRTGMGLTYGYHINIRNSYQLSFGISAKAYQFKLDDRDAMVLDEMDPLLLNNKKSFFVPDASTGIYISGRGIYGGLAVTELFGSSLKLGKNRFKNYHTMRHFNLIAGYKWAATESLILEPSVLAKATVSTLQADVSLRLFYQGNYWLGLTYRTNNTLVTMAGFNLEGFYLGYAYDASLGAFRNYSGGSHEIIIGYRLGDNNTRRARWLRPDTSEIGE